MELQQALLQEDIVGFSAFTMLGDRRYVSLRRCVAAPGNDAAMVEMPSFRESIPWMQVAGMEYWGLSALALWSSGMASFVYNAAILPSGASTGPTALLFIGPGNYNPHPDQEYFRRL